MDGFGIEDGGALVLATWLVVAGTLLPRTIEGPLAAASMVLVGGTVLLFGFDRVAPRPGTYLVLMCLMIALAAGVAALKSEVLFHCRYGYWRYLGRRASGRDRPRRTWRRV